MKRKTPQAPYGLIIGIDTGQKSNGLCVLDPRTGLREYESLGFIEEAIGSELLSRMAWLARQDGLRIFALIECPSWSGPGTREVRDAAKIWERTLQRLFPSRTVKKICPNVWQAQMLSAGPKTPSVERKAASMNYARGVIGMRPGSDHVADAICICEYAKLDVKGLVTG